VFQDRYRQFESTSLHQTVVEARSASRKVTIPSFSEKSLEICESSFRSPRENPFDHIYWRVGALSKATRAPVWRKQIGRFENRLSRPNRLVVSIGRHRRQQGYEDLALRLLSAQRFFIISDNRFLPAAVRRRPRCAAEPCSFPAVVFRALAGKLRSLSRAMA
jgi:hypothetical protein